MIRSAIFCIAAPCGVRQCSVSVGLAGGCFGPGTACQRCAGHVPRTGANPDARIAPRSGCAGLRSADYIVAVVNSEPVTNNEVRARMARVEDSLAKEGGQRPPQAQLAREVLERLILEKAQIQYAKEIGIKVDDYAVDQGMEAVARNNSISKALLRELKKEGIAEAVSATSCATR